MSLTSPKIQSDDRSLDQPLRPQSWGEYIGQENIKKNLTILLQAARERGEAVEHLLFYGPAGLGKTTLAHLVAREIGAQIKVTSGPAIERVGDLASILTNLSPGEILFIDEAHRLNKLIEEILYPALESRRLDIIIGKGPSARTLQLELPPFTLICATTRIALLSSPLLGVGAEPEAVDEIARRSRFTPRVANRLLKRARDFAQVEKSEKLTGLLARKALDLLAIDLAGLETTDRMILDTIISKFGGGPVGLQTLAAATSEEKETIEEVYEPYLMRSGFVERTPRGRIATRRAYEHLGRNFAEQSTFLA